MAFWLFMLIMNLLIPFTMIGFGFYFQKHPPKEINELFGYRTFGRVWLIWGWFSAAFSFPCMLLLYGKSDTACGIYGVILCFLQCIVLLFTLFIVERRLHRIFHKDGTRKLR